MSADPGPVRRRGDPSPAVLRATFGRNLRLLLAGRTVSAVCAAIGVNRTQFNRYLSGESFPRPEVLHRVCRHFGTDARILLEPLENLRASPPGPGPDIGTILNRAPGARPPPADMPEGFYLFTRRSMAWPDLILTHLAHVSDRAGQRFFRTYESRALRRRMRNPPPPWRLVQRGIVLPHDRGGLVLLYPPDGGICTILSLFAMPGERDTRLWTGTACRTIMEAAMPQRLSPVVVDYLPQDRASILAAARQSGPQDPARLPAIVRNWFALYP